MQISIESELQESWTLRLQSWVLNLESWVLSLESLVLSLRSSSIRSQSGEISCDCFSPPLANLFKLIWITSGGVFASARYIDTSCRCCRLHAFSIAVSLIKSKFRAAGINQASKWRLGLKIYIYIFLPVRGAQRNTMGLSRVRPEDLKSEKCC